MRGGHGECEDGLQVPDFLIAMENSFSFCVVFYSLWREMFSVGRVRRAG
ncbi:hypothetical protein AtDm6_0860 [Acetobacter tropicalis]|uniref:Uncharacterized protein n=1 Tax=Acetobacter tropicalis TaxID=104102 RepID=A0A094YWZ3_9PROT|nr:hypothetical protein AtDm6_0860 [Acetobacter tropicalis]